MGTGPSGRAIFQAHIDGLFLESLPIDLQWTLQNGVYQSDAQLFASGNTIVTPPSNTQLILIQPPSTNTVALLLKRVAGDTGYPLSNTMPNVITWNATPGSTFVLNCASQVTLQLTYLG